MVVLSLIFPTRVMAIFLSFTFTDWEDFGPILTLLVGLLGAASIRRSPQKHASRPIIVLMILLSSWPILPNFGLFFMALELQSVHGAWPVVMADDPRRWYGNVSPQFDALFHLVNYLQAFSGAWMVVFLALLFAAKAKFTVSQRRLFIGLALIFLTIAFLDPGNLDAWWLD